MALRTAKLITLVAAAVAFCGAAAAAGTLQNLHTFCETDCKDGKFPNGVTADQAGNLYGTSLEGGDPTAFSGVVYAMTTGGTEKVLHNFGAATDPDGAYPLAPPVANNDTGAIYGTTTNGGSNRQGVVYVVDPKTGRYSVIYRFCSQPDCTDGEQPGWAPLTVNTTPGHIGATLYGVAAGGGTGGGGTVFQLTPTVHAGWVYRVLYNFCLCPSGVSPLGGLIIAADGTLYGTTSNGGVVGAHGNGGGTVFSLLPNGKCLPSGAADPPTVCRRNGKPKLDVLYTFCSQPGCVDGANPAGGLVLDAAGNLYGTTQNGGANGYGTVFRLQPNATKTKWSAKVLHSFCAASSCIDGALPQSGLVLDASGVLYGTTRHGGTGQSGTVFGVNAAGGGFKVVYSFCSQPGCPGGGFPPPATLVDLGGILYGATSSGAAFAVRP